MVNPTAHHGVYPAHSPDSPAHSTSTVPHDAPDSPTPADPPMPSAAHRSVTDMIATLDAVAEDYDAAYIAYTGVIGKMIDHSLALDNHRAATLTALQDDVRECASACAVARAEAADQSAVRRARNDLEGLDKEHTALVQQIVTHQSDIAELRAQVSSTEREIRNVRATLEEKEAEFQMQFPTARYIHKILRTVSGAQVVSRENNGVIQGIILKGRNKDMVPFRYDDSVSQYEAVNNVWRTILA